MHDAIVGSGGDTLLLVIPFLSVLLVGFFRLDEYFAAPKHASRQGRPACGVDTEGCPILCDPDGRPWKRKSLGLRPLPRVVSAAGPFEEHAAAKGEECGIEASMHRREISGRVIAR